MHRLARNTLVLSAGQAVTVGSAMLFGLLIARRLGPETYGAYSLAFAFAGMFSVLFTLGVDQIVVREVARLPGQAETALRSALTARLCAFPVALALIVLTGHFLGYNGKQQLYIALAGLATGLSLLADLPRAIFQGIQRMAWDTISRLVEKGAALSLAVACLYFWSDLTLALFALIAGALAGLATGWLTLRRLAIGSAGLHLPSAWGLLRQSAPLLGSLGVIGLTSRLPLVVLSLARPTIDVGLYSAAFSLVDPFTIVSMAAAAALLPVASALLSARDVAINRLHESMLTAVLMVSLPVTAGLALFSGDVLRIVYGRAYASAALPMAILAVNLLCYSLAVYLHIYLIAAGAQSRFLLVALVQLGIALVANPFFAPRFGAAGTAASVALTQFAALLLIARFTSRLVRHHVNRRGISACLGTLAMVGAMTAARSLSLWLRAPLAVLLYAAVLLLTAGLTPVDLRRGFAFATSLLRPNHDGRTVAAGTFEEVR